MSLAASALTLPGRLHGVTLSLEPGQLTAIVGPNGAGKSSLLACLAGLVTPAHGTVLLGETPLAQLPPRQRARRLGYLPQSPEVAWDVTVETLVALGRLPWQGAPLHRAHATPAQDHAAVEAALSGMDLADLRRRPVSRLSGGERARALAARVLAGAPEWLLADEPLANLDLAHAAALIARLKAEARTGRGVVLVLHDLAAAMNHADRVIVLAGGQVAADGAPEQALSPALIERVWQVSGEWLGEAGRRTLSIA
ncbi:ABC transporter ATP-binding protein [Novosphingobium flavum]|uniref:ABC transporter ATP-binding protein n=1 Tax=Novosphingobium flavum TaxID=1778672 RepID=A0A7X1KK93_9SPHN|nr:ABC transporter ATP-binding protein [Novosphingobium flavum]MBC2663945.1 ABC transporter ATP-binding protein [Novosphingobium flavum]